MNRTQLNVNVLALPNMPVKRIMTRLGYREKTADKTRILSKYEKIIERYARTLKVRVFAVQKKFSIIDGQCDIEGYRFKSDLISRRLAGIKDVFLIGASCMPEDYRQIKEFEADGHLEQAVILDGALSEKVDWALVFLEKEISATLYRFGQIPGSRLSCGYGDFVISHQRYFFEQLQFEKYGIYLTDNYLLMPEKTVTALLPVRQIGRWPAEGKNG